MEETRIIRGRPRLIPKQSKQLKYFYLICVNFHGNDTLKLGISNNCYRRFREYNNANTVGYLKEIYNVYRCSNPKRLELILKYYLHERVKCVAKMEYFDIKYYDFIKEKLKDLAVEFDYTLTEIDYKAEREELLEKYKNKMLKKQKKIKK